MGDSDTEKQVEQAFEQIFDALHLTDAEKLAEVLSDRPGSIHIGSDPGESWTKSQFLDMIREAMSVGAGQIRAEHDKVNVQVAGDVAWIDTTGRFINDEGAHRDIRLTCVFVREDGRWKATQTHVSIGVPNDAIFEA
jgi:ketosteroid isomerase-like protein